MQSDGTLVMDRSDGSVRYAMAGGGNIAVMQNDGNFVEYDSAWRPLWRTGTTNGLANRLTIHDDANHHRRLCLVLGQLNGQAKTPGFIYNTLKTFQ